MGEVREVRGVKEAREVRDVRNRSLCRSFELLISEAERSELPSSIRSAVLEGLRYFHQQSLCDFNRRDSKTAIQARWLDFETLLLGTSFLDKFKANKSRWSQIELFVGHSNTAPPFLPRDPAKRPKSRLQGKDADGLIEHLARSLENKPVISPSEQEAVLFGLYYLELEAKRGRGQRNRQRIQITWRAIQPTLRKMGLLDEFDREPEAIKKIKAFVADRFL